MQIICTDMLIFFLVNVVIRQLILGDTANMTSFVTSYEFDDLFTTCHRHTVSCR